MVTRATTAAVLAAMVFVSSSVWAEEPAERSGPVVHHAPRMTARVGHDLAIGAAVERTDRLKRALLVYTSEAGEGELEFLRSSDAEKPYVAVIPGERVRGSTVGYAIEVETTDGERRPVFASRAQPHPVTVLDSAENAREGVLLARLGGRRSLVNLTGEYVSFGTSRAELPTPRTVDDRYYRVEASYTYRLLGTVAEFGMRAGMVRGRSLVPNETDPSKYDVGLNYGAPRVRLRADDWLHVEGELLISVTEVGFSSGGGGAILLGDPYGSKLTLGVEGIQVFGGRGYTRLDVVANRWLTLSPIVEVTNMPHADTAGVRLLAEVGLHLGAGLSATARGGYQARTFDQGGSTAGAGLSYAF